MVERNKAGGLAGWLLETWNNRRSLRERTVRTLQLVETLHVGAKRQLMLVRCGEEYFLAGSGLEGIQSIVKLEKIPEPREAMQCE